MEDFQGGVPVSTDSSAFCMNIEEQRNKLSEAWRAAAALLSVKIEAPHYLKSPDGTEVK
jgi:hypothetical protein